MKKTLLLACATFASLAAVAQTNSEISAQWLNLFDGTTSAGDQSNTISLAKDGGVYWFLTGGSTDKALDISYAGSVLYQGAPYVGTSNNGNLTLLKTAADGTKQWVVYSNQGDFHSTSGGNATTSDGGVIVVSKVRHTIGFSDTNLNLVDAKGTATTVEWKEEGTNNPYRIMATKISADGVIEWNRLYALATAYTGDTEKYVTDGFNLGTITVDNNDNIYFALNLKTTLTLPCKDGSSKDIVPANSTATGGDFVVVGLDNEGYYKNVLTLEGTAAVGYAQNVLWADGTLYAQGYITGDGTTQKVGDITLAPSEVMSPVVIATDANFDVKWAKCYPAEKVDNKNAIQSVGLSYADNTLWLAGCFNLKFTDPANNANFITATQGSLREGFILKLNGATGEWIKGVDSRETDWNSPSAVAKTGLTAYLKVLQNPANSDKIFVYGYVMNNTVGVFLREYDAVTLEGNLSTGQNNVITTTGTPTACAVAYDNTNGIAFMTARSNKAFAAGSLTTEAPTGWAVALAAIKLPEWMVGAVENISIDVDNSNTPVEYFDLSGRKVANPTKGLYIRRQGTNVTKVIL